MSAFYDYVINEIQPLSYWALNDLIGATAFFDDAKGVNGGVISGDPVLEEAPLVVNGDGTSLLVTNSFAGYFTPKQFHTDASIAFSLYFQIKLAVNPQTGAILCFGDPNAYGWGVLLRSDLTLKTFVGSASGSKIDYNSTTTLDIGTTYNVVLVYDGTGTIEGTQLYINSVLEDDITVVHDDILTGQLGSSNHYLWISYAYFSNPNEINAYIDNVIYLHRVLTPTELEHLTYLQDIPESPTLTPDSAILNITGSDVTYTQNGNAYLVPASALIQLVQSNVDARPENLSFISENLIVSDTLTQLAVSMGFTDNINVSDSYSDVVYIIRKIKEQINIDDFVHTNLIGQITIIDEQKLIDTVFMVISLVYSDEITTSTDYSVISKIPKHIAEIIQNTDLITNNVILKNTILDVLAITDNILLQVGVAIYENITIADTVSVILKAILDYNSSVIVTDNISPVFKAVTLITEDVTLSDNVANKITFAASILENIFTTGVIVIDNEHYTFVMNSKTKGVSEYTNFNFTSMSENLATLDDGIYELQGDTDNGQDISAIIRTGLMDFESNMQKQIPYAYLGLNKSGGMILKTIVTYKGDRKERWYSVTPRSVDGTDTVRIQMGRGIKAKYWQFELTNKNGSDFELDTFELLPLVLKRRV